MMSIETMPAIALSSIPHSHQRYETCGDWKVQPGRIEVLVSRMGNRDYEFLVAIHELVEVWLCTKRGISDEDVTKFDMKYEADRKAGMHPPEAEPGDNRLAPYKREHFCATNIERLLAAEMGIDWQEYEQAVNAL